jgi:hypothetical protein
MARTAYSYTLLALLAAGAVSNAQASCGAAFCTLNTAWEAQGVPSDPGLRLDLRSEYIDQDQPRTGRRDVAVGEIRKHHDEQRTLNRNIVTTLDYTANADWGVSVQLPYVQRDHTHIHNHGGAQLPESWQFDELGDTRMLGRYRLASGDITHGIIGGLKLPTGKTDVKNDAGAAAERSLQPGTGTTDVILGYYANSMRLLAGTPTRFFFQAQLQAPTSESKGFRSGVHYTADLGLAYPVADNWNALLQVNGLVKGRDRGTEGEPADSGGSFVWLSPGLGYSPTQSLQLYGFVQLPMYQRVNGVQLTADWSATVGVSVRF